MPRSIYGLRQRLADQVDSAKEFMEERQQDAQQWIIALIRAIGELLGAEAKTEWKKLITTAVSSEFLCSGCGTVDSWTPVEENCISVSVVDATNPDVRLTSLKKVVNQFFHGELIEDRRCGHCDTKGAIKRFSIRRLPKVTNNSEQIIHQCIYRSSCCTSRGSYSGTLRSWIGTSPTMAARWTSLE